MLKLLSYPYIQFDNDQKLAQNAETCLIAKQTRQLLAQEYI